MKKDLFLDFDPRFSDFGLVISFEVLNGASNLERLEKLEQFVFGAAKAHNDKACLKLLELLKRAYEFGAYALEKFHEKLKEIYHKLPDQEADRNSVHKSEATLEESKQWILKEIARHWMEEKSPQSVAAFRFLCEVYASKNRAIYPKERENILQIVQEKTGRWFKPEHLEEWFKEPNVSQEIREKLVIARARNGGVKLAEKDIRNGEFLRGFQLEERSSSAIELAKYLLNCVTQLDCKIEKLKKAMQGNWGPPWDKIGKSEYVKGEMEVAFRSLHDFSTQREVIFKITLPAGCSEELGRDIFGRAKRHAKKWMEEDEVGYLMLHVEGGTANLQLSKSYSKS